MDILGLSCFYHDAAACLVRDGRLVAAAQEERFTRLKHDASFPAHAVAYCLREGGIAVADLDAVAFYDKPFLTFERLLETYLAFAPRGLASFLKAMPLWLKKKLWTPDVIARELGYDGSIFFTEHHESHAASAFFPSPFERAAVLTADGVGEWATTSYGVGEGNRVRLLAELHFPHSLGLLYSAFTYFCGFRVNSGEYKLMGLAPYGEPRYAAAIRRAPGAETAEALPRERRSGSEANRAHRRSRVPPSATKAVRWSAAMRQTQPDRSLSCPFPCGKCSRPESISATRQDSGTRGWRPSSMGTATASTSSTSKSPSRSTTRR